MRRSSLWPAVLPFLLALALCASRIGQGRADEGHMFIIAAAQGYGVEDCLAEGEGECGRSVADAWCEAHGRGAAKSFGIADDVTGAIPAQALGRKSQPPYFVRCGD